MRLLITTEYRFEQGPDGKACSDMGRSYSFWQRYLDVFDSVCVVGRLSSAVSISGRPVEGPGVFFFPLPGYRGLWEYLLTRNLVRHTIKDALKPDDAIIMRVPSLIANLMVPLCSNLSHPFGLEIVGDPWDVFSPGTVRYPWPVRVFLRHWFTRQLRKQCQKAIACAYVTERSLQRRYPPGGKTFSTSFSSVDLPPEALVATARTFERKDSFRLITVGTLDQLYKGIDVLINALSIIKRALNFQLIIVGDGTYREYLENLCVKKGIRERVQFAGRLPAGEPVRRQLDQADLFVLPSRQEGLPRAMIEAMARALPCIGTTVGGIPELLPPEDLVPPNDARALAARIQEVLSDPERMGRMSARNLAKAWEYREEVLREKRQAFYRYVREATEKWLKNQVTVRSGLESP